MNRQEILSVIREELAVAAPDVPRDADPAAHFGLDLEVDSLAVLEFVARLEYRFGLAAEGHALDVACRVDDAVWGGAVPGGRVRGRALARRAAREALEDAGLLCPDGRLVPGLDPSRVPRVRRVSGRRLAPPPDGRARRSSR